MVAIKESRHSRACLENSKAVSNSHLESSCNRIFVVKLIEGLAIDFISRDVSSMLRVFGKLLHHPEIH